MRVGETRVFTGRVRALGGGKHVVARSSLAIAGANPVRHFDHHPFELELADGPRVRVETDTKVQLLPESERSGTWAKLADACAEFRSQAPGPHVQVTLTRAAINDGAEVTLRASVVSEQEGVPTALHATTIATGDARKLISDATAAPPLTRLSTGDRVVLAFGAVAAAGAGLAHTAPVRTDLAGIAVAFGLCVLVMRHFRIDAPRFFVPDASDRASNRRVRVKIVGGAPLNAFAVTLIVMAIMITGGDGCGHAEQKGGTVNAAPVTCAFLAVVVVALAVGVFAGGRQTARYARMLRDARPHAHPAVDGEWGSSSGIVAMTGTTQPLLAERERSRIGTQESSSISISEHVTAADHELVRPDGTRLRIDPRNACWTTARDVEGVPFPPPDEQNWDQVFPIDGISAGAQAIVVGRMQFGGELAATGPESLVIWASANAPPLRQVARFLAARTRLLVILGIAAIGFAALVFWHPFLGPLTMFHASRYG